MAGGGGDSGQSMLGGLIGGLTGKEGWQGIIDPGGILMKAPPPAQAFPFETGQPTTMAPQDTDRLAFLKAFGVQG
jgi:hypothetical protein